MKKSFLMLLTGLAVFSFMLAACSSSGGGGNLGDVSGVWKGNDCDCEVTINLAGKEKLLKIGEKSIAVKVKAVENDKIVLNVKNGSGQADEWKLIKQWNDNGSEFSLTFLHEGVNEKLSLVKKLT